MGFEEKRRRKEKREDGEQERKEEKTEEYIWRLDVSWTNCFCIVQGIGARNIACQQADALMADD
jgi:hypothetical protein